MQSAARARYSPRLTTSAAGEQSRYAGRISLLVIGQSDRRAAGKSQRPRIELAPSEEGRDDQNDDDHESCFAHDAYALLATASALRSTGMRRKATPVAA